MYASDRESASIVIRDVTIQTQTGAILTSTLNTKMYQDDASTA